jgi:putative heme transporter
MGTAVAHVEDRSEGFELPAPDVRALARRAAVPAALVLVAAAALVAVSGPLQAFADAIQRALSADPRWVVAAGAFELLSFGGYIALLWLVGGRATRRIGPRESAQITLGGTAASRLLPTAGVGGAALTLWALRRSGLDTRTATRTLLAFLVVLYSVFFISVAVSGALLASGVAANDGPFALSAVPAAAAALIIAIGLAIGARRLAPARAPASRTGSRWEFRARSAAALLGAAVRDALALVRSGDPRLLGAVAWWAFDAAVLWAMLNAFGAPPSLIVIVLAYFVGQVGNTLPIPGAVSGGLVGVLIAFGVEADLALVSVLAYRAIAIWLPAPLGLAVLGGLRKTLASWKRDEAEDSPVVLPVPTEVPVRVAA